MIISKVRTKRSELYRIVSLVVSLWLVSHVSQWLLGWRKRSSFPPLSPSLCRSNSYLPPFQPLFFPLLKQRTDILCESFPIVIFRFPVSILDRQRTTVFVVTDRPVSRLLVPPPPSISTGRFGVLVSQDGHDKRVHQFENVGSFGELALLYNMPRSASIVAETEGVLWAMDRASFRRIVQRAAFKVRWKLFSWSDCLIKPIRGYPMSGAI